MKIPMYTLIGPVLRKNSRVIRKFCSYPLLNVSAAYACFLGIIGVLLSVIDIIRIIQCGPVLPCSLWRTRIYTGKVVSAECERDLKLISLVLSMEYYMLLILGTFMKNPALFLPYLILYSFIIFLEFVLLLSRLLTDGFNYTKHSLILSIFVVYNYLAIFCAFFHISGMCDF